MTDSGYLAEFSKDLARARRITRLAASGVDATNRRSLIAHLPTLTCRMVGGADSDAAGAQLAWALLYDAAHLIDQVQDEHLTTYEDRGQALNAAVALFFEAVEHIGHLPSELQAKLYTLMRENVVGQYEDCSNPHPTVPEALAIAEKKTGSFLGLGCWLGAAGALTQAAPEDRTPLLEAFLDMGRAFGVLVQIHDDLEWLEGLDTERGRNRERFSNLILSAAWALEAPEARGALDHSVLHLPDSSWEERADLRRRLVVLGSRAICGAQAQQYRRKALAALARISVVDRQATNWLQGQIEDAARVFRAQRTSLGDIVESDEREYTDEPRAMG